MKKINSDIFFKIAIFFLPFENFFFAPSAGWAAISPIILALYLVLNLKTLGKSIAKFHKITFFFLIGIIITSLNWLMVDVSFSNYLNTLISLGLGLICLFSISVFYEKNKDNLQEEITKIVRIMLISYMISLICGIIEYIAIKYSVSSLYNFFAFLFKRNYLRYNRIQFMFTEPSFIGMHLFGVLLPMYFLTKNKKLLILIISFSIASIAFSSGLRIILDVLIVSLILLYYYLYKNKKYFLMFFIPIFGIILFAGAYNYNYRIRQIYDKGIYADGSLASRYFRINASIKGYKNNPFHFLIGYGMGNSLKPLRSGYTEAVAEYKSNYLTEVIELGDLKYNDDSVSYCLYIRLISEYGFILFVVLILYLYRITKESNFKYKWPYLLIILYLYLQFESLAFYALWLYINVIVYTKNTKLKTKNEDLILTNKE